MRFVTGPPSILYPGTGRGQAPGVRDRQTRDEELTKECILGNWNTVGSRLPVWGKISQKIMINFDKHQNMADCHCRCSFIVLDGCYSCLIYITSVLQNSKCITSDGVKIGFHSIFTGK